MRCLLPTSKRFWANSVQDGLESPEVSVDHDATEAILGGVARKAALGHRLVAPPTGPGFARTPEQAFDKVGGGQTYAVYLPQGGSTTLELRRSTDAFQVRWYNPRSGGELLQGSVSEVRAPSTGVSLGLPLGDIDQDWVAFVNKK